MKREELEKQELHYREPGPLDEHAGAIRRAGDGVIAELWSSSAREDGPLLAAAPALALAAIEAGVLLEELRHECVMSGGESGRFVEVLNKLDAALAQAGVEV